MPYKNRTPSRNKGKIPNSPANRNKNYEYEVIKPLPVIQGKIAPAFGEPGGGVQILPNLSDKVDVDWLLANEYLRDVK